MIDKRIRMLIKQHGITQKDLAEFTGISIHTIKNWNRGAEVTAADLLLVANYFDVSLDYLAGNVDNPHSHKPATEATLDVLKSISAFIEEKIEETKKLEVPLKDAEWTNK